MLIITQHNHSFSVFRMMSNIFVYWKGFLCKNPRVYSFGRLELQSNPNLTIYSMEISSRSPLPTFQIAIRLWRYPGRVLELPVHVANEYTPSCSSWPNEYIPSFSDHSKCQWWWVENAPMLNPYILNMMLTL